MNVKLPDEKLAEGKIARTENWPNKKLPEASRIFLNVTVGGDT